MEKQHRLVVDILRRLSEAGVLKHVLVIGSWATSFYKDYFAGSDYAPIIRTRDIDLLVQRQTRFARKIDLAEVMSPLGFEIQFSGNGYMRLESDELILEMLVPEIGPTKDKPYPLPDLKFNAQPLRHLRMLWRDPIVVTTEGVQIMVPHPADYCLHKLIISSRRQNSAKKEKDLHSALLVLENLIEKEGPVNLKKSFSVLTKNEQKEITAALAKNGQRNIQEILS